MCHKKSHHVAMVGLILFNLQLGYPSVGLESVTDTDHAFADFVTSSCSRLLVVLVIACVSIDVGTLAESM